MWLGLQICSVPNQYNISHFGKWFESILEATWCSREDKQLMLSFVMITLWNIWKTRNLMCFEDKSPNPDDTLYAIKVNCSALISPIPTPTHQMGASSCPRRSVPK